MMRQKVVGKHEQSPLRVPLVAKAFQKPREIRHGEHPPTFGHDVFRRPCFGDEHVIRMDQIVGFETTKSKFLQLGDQVEAVHLSRVHGEQRNIHLFAHNQVVVLVPRRFVAKRPFSHRVHRAMMFLRTRFF